MTTTDRVRVFISPDGSEIELVDVHGFVIPSSELSIETKRLPKFGEKMVDESTGRVDVIVRIPGVRVEQGAGLREEQE